MCGWSLYRYRVWDDEHLDIFCRFYIPFNMSVIGSAICTHVSSLYSMWLCTMVSNSVTLHEPNHDSNHDLNHDPNSVTLHDPIHPPRLHPRPRIPTRVRCIIRVGAVSGLGLSGMGSQRHGGSIGVGSIIMSQNRHVPETACPRNSVSQKWHVPETGYNTLLRFR